MRTSSRGMTPRRPFIPPSQFERFMWGMAALLATGLALLGLAYLLAALYP